MRNKNRFKFVNEHRVICCNEQSENKELHKINDDYSILEHTLEELTEDTAAKDRYIEKLKRDIRVFTDDALKTEKEMQELLDEQERLLKTVSEEKKALKKVLDEIENKISISIAVQTENKDKRDMSTQVGPQVATKGTSMDCITSTDVCTNLTTFESRIISDEIPKVEKPRLLLVSGYHGKNVARFLSYQSQNFKVTSFVKPNASTTVLIKTAIDNAMTFTKKDFVIVWTSALHPQLIDGFILQLETITNCIVITEPYRYDETCKQSVIYYNNLNFYKKLNNRNIKLSHVFECNSVLNKTCFQRNSPLMNNKGKNMVSLALLAHISKHFRETITQRNIAKIDTNKSSNPQNFLEYRPTTVPGY